MLKLSLRHWRSVWVLCAIIPAIIYLFDRAQALPIIENASTSLLGTLPFICFAVALIGILKASGAESLIVKAFEGKEIRMIFAGALIGSFAPFCSCEVIPFVAGLLTLGAPLSAVMAFWLSSPLIDLPAMIITASALGWDFAIAKAIAAVAIGLFGGFAILLCRNMGMFENVLHKSKSSSCSSSACQGGSSFSVINWCFWHDKKRIAIFTKEIQSNGLFLLKWLTFAYLVQGLLVFYVPAEFIASIVGGKGISSIILGALVGAPAYLNGYAAPALVAGLIEQGMSIGAAMAFLISGAVSSIPAMIAVYSLVHLRVFVLYLALGVFGAIIAGVVFGAL